MSCETESNRFRQSAARRNGIAGYAGRYLNTLGSWSTYQGVEGVEALPARLAEVTEAFFGVKGLLSGRPRLAGVLGAMLAVHALEQASGAVATLGMRLWGRGKPTAQYRGVILREPPPSRWGQAVSQVSGGRVRPASGLYFFESGRTWAASTVETSLGDTAKTLTTLRSYTLPGRAFYFDRRLEPQTLVDVALGDRDPDTLPGFIGSVNELENSLLPLGNLKRLGIFADWLLRDSTERDGGGSLVDYDLRGGPSSGGSSGGYDRVTPRRPSPTGGWSPTPSRFSASRSPASSLRKVPISSATRPSQVVSLRRSADSPQRIPGLSPAGPEPPPNFPDDGSTNGATNTVTLNIDGQDRQVVVERVFKDPIRQVSKAEARYYDPDLGAWRRVVDDALRLELAKAVERGTVNTER